MISFTNKYFYRNIWNLEEDLLSTYKGLYINKNSFNQITDNPIYDLTKVDGGDEVWLRSETNNKKYIEFVEGFYEPIDILSEYIKKESLEKGIWGVEIGLPYFALTSHLSPVAIRNMALLINVVDQMKQTKKLGKFIRKDFLYINQLGDSESYREAYRWLYKHTLAEERSDYKASATRDEINDRTIKAIASSSFGGKYSKFLWLLEKNDNNLCRKIDRSAKWDKLRQIKNKRYEDRQNKFGISDLIIKIFIFLKNYDRTNK